MNLCDRASARLRIALAFRRGRLPAHDVAPCRKCINLVRQGWPLREDDDTWPPCARCGLAVVRAPRPNPWIGNAADPQDGPAKGR